MNSPQTVDLEFAAMQAVFDALYPLDDDARVRVVTYITARLDIELRAPSKPAPVAALFDSPNEESPGVAPTSGVPALTYGGGLPHFGTFAELYDAVRPQSTAAKVLAAGYWLQVCEAGESSIRRVPTTC